MPITFESGDNGRNLKPCYWRQVKVADTILRPEPCSKSLGPRGCFDEFRLAPCRGDACRRHVLDVARRCPAADAAAAARAGLSASATLSGSAASPRAVSARADAAGSAAANATARAAKPVHLRIRRTG